GNVTLSNVTVNDTPPLDNFSCSPSQPATLNPGDSITCTGTHTVTLADLNAGQFDDTACANATGASQVCAPDTVPASQTKTLSITKTDNLNPAHYDHVGQVITYTITATNTGNVTLSNVTVNDTPPLDNFSCSPSQPATLNPGDSITCTGTHTVTLADLNAGQFDDTACANATGASQVCAPDTVPASQTKTLSITKTDDTVSYDHVGQVITYTIT